MEIKNTYLFWFVFILVTSLIWSVAGFYLFDVLPPMWLFLLNLGGIMWCFFSGIVPIIHQAILRTVTYWTGQE